MADINENPQAEIPQIPPVQQLKGIGGWLLLFVIGSFLSAIANFALAFGGSSYLGGGMMVVTNPGIALIIGICALTTAIMLIKVRNKNAILAARIYMGVYLLGVVIISITGLEAPSGYYIIDETGVIVRGIMSGILFNAIWQPYFFKSKRVKATYLTEETTSATFDFKIGNTLVSVFDKQKFGINYYFGAAVFVSLLLSTFIYPLFDSLWYGYHFRFWPIEYYLTFQLPVKIFYSVLFVALFHFLRNDWLIAISIGLGTLIISIIWRTIFNNATFGDLTLRGTITVQSIYFSFSWSFFIVLSMILALKIWGFKYWSFLVWFFICQIADGLLSTIVTMIVYSDLTFSFSFVIYAIVEAFITGSLIFLSIQYFLKNKGVITETAA